MKEKKDLTNINSDTAFCDELLANPPRLQHAVELYSNINQGGIAEILLDYLDEYYIFTASQLRSLCLLLASYQTTDDKI